MAREPQYMSEYAAEMNKLGPTAFQVKYRGAVLVGIGMVAKVSERPLSWRRRTLAAIELDEVAFVQSLVDRVWRVRKDPGSQRGAAITAGQSADNDIVLPEYTVSTQHAAFNFDAAGMSIMDLGSLNGTKVDGVLVEPHANFRLKDKAQIVMGRIKFDFWQSDSFVAAVRNQSDYR
jgi:pSer/pThr/pTyr-binding forkhead associated (FHA) protein